jgi:hypothetical protein
MARHLAVTAACTWLVAVTLLHAEETREGDRDHFRIIAWEHRELKEDARRRIVNIKQAIYGIESPGGRTPLGGMFGDGRWKYKRKWDIRTPKEAVTIYCVGAYGSKEGGQYIGYDLKGEDAFVRLNEAEGTGIEWELDFVPELRGYYLRPKTGPYAGWYLSFDEAEEFQRTDGLKFLAYRAKLEEKPGKMSLLINNGFKDD